MKSAYERAASYVAKMDAAVEGSHGDDQTFTVACRLVNFGLGQSDAMKLMGEYNKRCQPPWKEKDLERRVKNAFRVASPKSEFADDLAKKEFVSNEVPHGTNRTATKWPAVNVALRSRIIGTGFGVFDLMDLSDDFPTKTTSLEFLRLLFPGNPLICCGMSAEVFDTKPLEDWGQKVSAQQYIVPSPMSKLEGLTLEGNPSTHCLDNTGPRRFLVCEFDSGTTDEQCALLRHLSGYAPLVMAVHSAGKSVHGWFAVAGEPVSKVNFFFRYAVSLGADYRMDVLCQFARMPQGTRYAMPNNLVQTVYFFNQRRIPA